LKGRGDPIPDVPRKIFWEKGDNHGDTAPRGGVKPRGVNLWGGEKGS